MRMSSTPPRPLSRLADELRGRAVCRTQKPPPRKVYGGGWMRLVATVDQSDDGSFLGCWTGISAWQQRIAPVPGLVHSTIVPHVSH